jgi:RNA polymerase sigma-70 factor (ECF subfamily)
MGHINLRSLPGRRRSRSGNARKQLFELRVAVASDLERAVGPRAPSAGPWENFNVGADVRDEAGAPPTDEQLLTAARQGDASALEALLVRYQPHLFRFGLRMCGNVEDASDVAQESLISMARAVRDFRGDSSVSSWLYTIARRFCIKKRRRSKFAPTRVESLDAPGVEADLRIVDTAPGPEQTAASRELGAALIRAIDALESPQREVLLLRDVEGLSAPDVARVLGISVDAVKSRLHRARVEVREKLAPMLGPPATETAGGATCPDVLALFTRHLDGDLDPRVCAAMEAHLAQCTRCHGACESLKRVLAVCRQLPTPDVPAPVAASVKKAIQTFLGHG